MRILHTESSTGWGGQELRILNEIAQMRQRGHHVVLACKEASPIWYAAHQRQLHLTAIPFSRALLQRHNIKRLSQILAAENIQIVNTHSSADSWAASIAAKRTNVVCIRSRHICSPMKNDILHRIQHHYLTNAFITTGESLRQDLIACNGITPERIISIPSGVEQKYFLASSYDNSAIRKELGIPATAFVWCMTAFMRKMKGHTVLIDAIALLRAQFPHTHFIFIGGVDSHTAVTPELSSQSTHLGVNDICHFLGTRQDVPQILAGSDAFVLPSLYTEGLPQGLTQAMAMGLPAVSTDVGAITEVLQHNSTGYIAQAGDAKHLADTMAHVMTNYREAQQKAAAAQQLIATHYSLDAMVSKVETFYNQWI